MSITFENLPERMKQFPNWVVWRLEDRGGRKLAKIPYNVTGGYAKVNDPATWANFDEALGALQGGQFNGVGFVFTGTPFVGVDIDACVDPATGEIMPEALDALQILNSYTELSQSRGGFHIIVEGQLPKGRRRNGKFEMYGDGSPRFFAMTGNLWGNYREVRADQGAIDEVHRKYIERDSDRQNPTGEQQTLAPDLTDEQVLERAKNAKNGALFTRLWNGSTEGYASQSEADLALANMLGFWTRCNAEQMDRLFRQSGLYRPKWDEMRGAQSYGEYTIQNAIAGCREVYAPQVHFKKRAAHATCGIGQNKRILADLHPEKNDKYGWHDMGNGNLFADWYKDKARYVPERKKWFVYNGKVWRADTGDLKVMELCKKLADDLACYALTLEDELIKQTYLAFVSKWQRRSYRETILKDAASVHPIALKDFDADQFLFNCLNGTLDLRNGLFRAHNPDDLLSKISNVKYDPEAKSDRWERFIDEVMQGDQDKAVFLQKSMGYALSGDTRHECFFILYGSSSRNGKSTAMETFLRMMGDYGKTGRPDSLAQKQTANGSGPSEDIARLAGARFVNISEPDKKLVLSAALVKTLTGNDTVTARYLNENSFEYKPQFKLFINTNHLPTVTDATLFSSGRVKIIPFERHFGEDERDEGLKDELSRPENLSGIFNWCFEGLRLIEETGFDAPAAVREATNEYRRNSDRVSRFIDEAMEPDPFAETRTQILYDRYKEWCYNNGFHPENAANFKISASRISTVVKRRPRGSNRTASPVSLFLGFRFKNIPTL